MSRSYTARICGLGRPRSMRRARWVLVTTDDVRSHAHSLTRATRRASLVRQYVRGDWCEAWSSPSRRKRKLARPEGAAPTATYNKTCLWNCNNVGVCDHTTGRCRCRAGWQGTSCEERQDRPCSQRTRPRGSFTPASSEFEFGADWKASMCAGDCDEDIGACFCPSWTKYGRSVANNDPREPPKRPGTSICRELVQHLTQIKWPRLSNKRTL